MSCLRTRSWVAWVGIFLNKRARNVKSHFVSVHINLKALGFFNMDLFTFFQVKVANSTSKNLALKKSHIWILYFLNSGSP